MTSPDLYQPGQPGRLEDMKPTIGGLASIMLSNVGTIAQNIFRGIADAVAGLFKGQSGALGEISDGQVSLNGRTDLLSPLLDYRSCSTPPTGGDAMKGTGRIPFNYQIGPYQNVSNENNALVLNDKGLWDLRCQVTCSWTAAVWNADIRVYLQVLRPDNTVYSQQSYYMSTTNSVTIPVVSSVVIPEAGYQVVVWVVADGGRGWWSGPEWTRLTVQHISRKVEGGTGGEESTTPTEPPEEPDEPSEPEGEA